MVTIRWNVRCTETWPGDSLVVVGSSEALGSWDPSSACHLRTSQEHFPQWHGVTVLPKLTSTLFWKLVILRADGTALWEEGENRNFEIPCQGALHHQEAYFGWTDGHLNPCVYKVGEEACIQALPVPATRANTDSTVCTKVSPVPALRANTDSTICTSSSSESLNSIGSSSSLTDADNDFWFSAGGCTIGKTSHSCEDAYFFGKKCLAVADGVGGSKQFAPYGMDAGAYATQLTQLAVQALDSREEVEWQENHENPALKAFSSAEAGATVYGASTLCVTCLSASGRAPTMSAANLGDSGFIVLRESSTSGRKTVVAKSRGQQHAWNRPYQLMRVPPALAKRVEQVQGGKPIQCDTADDCHLYEVTVCVGDLILLFTDGFSDNVDCQKMLDIVHLAEADYSGHGKAHLVDLTQLAERLAGAAHLISLDPDAQVPFRDSAREAGRITKGGKRDDITVVAARVMSQSLSDQSDFGLARSKAYSDMSAIVDAARLI